jgi:DedD protein
VAAHRIYFAAVERHVKERLVGAAVLVAAAVILIPEMLSGPREQRDRSVAEVAAQVAEQGGEPPLKTYTIDLSQSPAAKDAATPESVAPPTVIQAPAPPPENVEPAAAAEPASSEAVAPDQQTPESPAVENQPNDATSVDAPSQRDVAPPATSPANHEAPPRSEQVTDKGWAVQLASLDSQSAANSMSTKLRDKGYEAFVMPFKKGSTTWYRVRIGPVKDRQAAAELQRKVKETTPGAIVVPHP